MKALRATTKDTMDTKGRTCARSVRFSCVLSFVSFVSLGGRAAGRTAAARRRHPSRPSAAGRRLIVQTVTVKDKDGKPIEGLTAKDFTVTEDGEPQTISFVEFQRLPGTTDSSAPVAPAPPPVAAPANPAPSAAPLTQAQILVPPPGDLRYRDRRLMVLYFDPAAMQMPDLMRAYTSSLKYIDTQMGPADLLAIMTFQRGAVRVRQDFTDNRAQLRELIQTLIFGDDADGDGIPDPLPGGGVRPGRRRVQHLQHRSPAVGAADRGHDAAAAGGAEVADLLRQRSAAERHRQPGAAARHRQRGDPLERRHPYDRRARSGGDAAARRRDAAVARRPRHVQRPVRQRRARRNFQRSQDSLYALAKDTGGKAMFDYNDLSQGIVQAAQTMTSYYLLGYYSTHIADDGRFRRVKVTLNGGLSADLSYRQGYFADKTFAKFTTADKERQLEDALMLENPITEITIAMEVNYFQLNRAEYFIPVAVKIPGSELALARRGGAQRTLIDFIGDVKDDYGYTRQNIRDKLDIKLSDATAAQLATRPIRYQTGFTLLPGKYVIKLLARDAETGRMGTYQTSFTVPNLNREEKRIPISSVVLSSQRVPLGDALYSVEQKIAAEAVNPLVFEGQKLIPSVTRVFSKIARSVRVPPGLRAGRDHDAAAGGVRHLLSRRREGVRNAAAGRDRAGWTRSRRRCRSGSACRSTSWRPGHYTCQVTVLDPSGREGRVLAGADRGRPVIRNWELGIRNRTRAASRESVPVAGGARRRGRRTAAACARGSPHPARRGSPL